MINIIVNAVATLEAICPHLGFTVAGLVIMPFATAGLVLLGLAWDRLARSRLTLRP